MRLPCVLVDRNEYPDAAPWPGGPTARKPRFSESVFSTTPVRYQWRFNGADTTSLDPGADLGGDGM